MASGGRPVARPTVLVTHDHWGPLTGWGQFATRIAQALDAPLVRRSDVIESAEYDVQFDVVHPSGIVQRSAGCRKHVVYTMCEVSRLRQDWVDNINRCADLVVVPAPAIVGWMWGSCVSKKIVICPPGVPQVFYDVSRRRVANDRFVFGSMFADHLSPVRKGYYSLVDCFLRAFPDGKASDDTPVFLEIVRNVGDCDVHDPLLPFIRVRKATLSNKEVASWMVSIDCYVNASRGEGFCLPTLESAVTGAHIISSVWGGPSEYVGHLSVVGAATVVSTTPGRPYALGYADSPPEARWEVPDEASMIEAMRQAAATDRTGTNTESPDPMLVENYSMAAFADRLRKIIEEIA